MATVAVLGAGFGATGVTAAPLEATACAAGLALWSARDLPPAVGGAVAPPVARAGLSLVLFAGFATVTNLDVVAANRVLTTSRPASTAPRPCSGGWSCSPRWRSGSCWFRR